MSAEAAIQIRRLSDLDEWEFYEVAVPGEDAPLTIGLRPYTEFGQVEYEVWEDSAEAPRFTGSVPCDAVGERWTEAMREPIVEEILNQVKGQG